VDRGGPGDRQGGPPVDRGGGPWACHPWALRFGQERRSGLRKSEKGTFPERSPWLL